MLWSGALQGAKNELVNQYLYGAGGSQKSKVQIEGGFQKAPRWPERGPPGFRNKPGAHAHVKSHAGFFWACFIIAIWAPS